MVNPTSAIDYTIINIDRAQKYTLRAINEPFNGKSTAFSNESIAITNQLILQELQKQTALLEEINEKLKDGKDKK